MKFKIIFLFFNLVIIISFLVIFFMPLIMLGGDYAGDFWKDSWFLPVLFLLAVVGIDSYFFYNWKLFRYLEEEDWERAIEYLEGRLESTGRISASRLRILINTYILKSRIESLETLEAKVREKVPKLHSRYALSLGIPKLLKTDAEGLEFFYGPLREKPRKDQDWIRYLYSFALLLQERREEAREELKTIIEGPKSRPVVLLMALYSLSPFSAMDQETASFVSDHCARLKERYSRPAMEKEIQKSREQLVPIMMGKLTEEALQWLYQTPREELA